MLHISIAAETIGYVGSFPVTNALLSTWIIMAFLLITSLVLTQQLKRKPGRMQVALETLVGGLFSFFENIGGNHGKHYAPLAVAIFIFVLSSNWFGLLPGVGTIGVNEYSSPQETHTDSSVLTPQIVEAATETTDTHEEVVPAETTEQSEGTTMQDEVHAEEAEEHVTFIPLFRAPTADLNTTIALALIAVFVIQYYGFRFAGGTYFKRFFNVKSPIFFFVGLLELVSDLSKIISFAFRLFGNIFAGEVLLAVMAFLFAFLLPIPFYGLELFVGVVQALVFGMLTVVFTSIAVTEGEHLLHGHKEKEAAEH